MKLSRFILLMIAFAVFSVGTSFAANVVTYTASSKVSQKDADKKALEGVALQIGAKVKSSFETRTVENVDGSVSSTADSKKSVSTNILLKGAKLQEGPKKNGLFQSTASVDLDQLASKILLDLELSRVKMKSLDSIIRLDMLDRDYHKMESDMIQLERLASAYDELLENLSYVQRVPDNLRLESTLGELTEFLISSMQTVKLDAAVSSGELQILVSDFAGPIANFPVVISQEGKDLSYAKTSAEGVAVFKLDDVKKLKPSGELTVFANMNFRFVRRSALQNAKISYGAAKMGGTFKLVCSGGVAECGSLQKFLTDLGFVFSSEANVPELGAVLEFSDKPNSSKTLYTSRLTLKLKKSGSEIVEQSQGVGRDAEAAHVKAVMKLPFNKILEMLR